MTNLRSDPQLRPTVAESAASCVAALVDLFGLALIAAGVLGTVGALTLSVIQAMPWLQVCSTLVLSGVIILCRWRG